MAKNKKTFILKRFTPYMGKKKALLPLSLVLSGVSAGLNILPFVLVWYIVRDILSSPQSIDMSNVGFYAWIAFASAMGGIVVYFCALLSSHLAAFRVEVGMQKVGMEKILLLYNPATYETADVISTFVYRKGILEMSFSYSTAVGLFNSVISFILVVTVNKISRKLTESSLW